MRRRSGGAGWAIAALLSWLAGPALAAGTVAGTDITNTATASFTDPGGTGQTVSSNVATVRVAELLNITVVRNDAGHVGATSPGQDVPLSFTVTNTGNGQEPAVLASDLSLAGDAFDPQLVSLVLDSNGNGVYDPSADTVYRAGANEPALAPDQSIVVFIVSDMPENLASGAIGLAALTGTAATGSGSPGTVFAGAGDGGIDAVVGATTASASDRNGYVVSQVAAVLTKTQAVADPFGGTQPIPGAIITYTLTFAVTGEGALAGTAIADPVPVHTTYVAESLRLDGAALSDADDADAGRGGSGGIAVSLGTVASPATRTISFQVQIQ